MKPRRGDMIIKDTIANITQTLKGWHNYNICRQQYYTSLAL